MAPRNRELDGKGRRLTVAYLPQTNASDTVTVHKLAMRPVAIIYFGHLLAPPPPGTAMPPTGLCFNNFTFFF